MTASSRWCRADVLYSVSGLRISLYFACADCYELLEIHSASLEALAILLSVEVVNLTKLGRLLGHIYVMLNHSQEGDDVISPDRRPVKLSTQSLWFIDSTAFPKPLGNVLGHC